MTFALVATGTCFWACGGDSKDDGGSGGSSAGTGTGASSGSGGSGLTGGTAGTGGLGGGAGSGGTAGAACVKGGNECFHKGAFIGSCLGNVLNDSQGCTEYYEPTTPSPKAGCSSWSDTARCPTDELNGRPLVGCCSDTSVIGTVTKTRTLCRYVKDTNNFWRDSVCSTCGKLAGCFTDYLVSPPDGGVGGTGGTSTGGTGGTSTGGTGGTGGADAGVDASSDGGGSDASADSGSDGGNTAPPKAIISGQSQPYGMDTDATHVYWVNRGSPRRVMRALKDGTGVQVVVDNAPSVPVHVQVDATHAYYSTYTGGGIYRVLKGGGTPQTLATGLSNPWALLLVGSDIYFTTFEFAATGTISKLPKAGGTASPVISSLPDRLGGLVLEDGFYWLTHANKGIKKIPVGGTAASIQNVFIDSGYDAFLDSDGTSVYWASGSPGNVRRYRKDGTQTTPFDYVSNQGSTSTYGIATDGTYVFWTNYTTGTVHRAGLGYTP